MLPVVIDEANALHVRIDLVIDRATGACRWATHGMTSVHDLAEQHLICQAVRLMLEASQRAAETESTAVN